MGWLRTKWLWLGPIIIISIITGAMLWRSKSTSPIHTVSTNSPVTANCSTFLTASPIALTDLAAIFPMGKMGSSSGHVTPTDHQYWLPNGITETSNHLTDPTRYRIYAPGDGTLVSLGHLPDILNGVRVNDFRVEIDYGCGISSAMMHVSRLTPSLQAEFDAHQQNDYASIHLPLKAGDQIGTAGPHNVDFMVWDNNTTLPGFVNAKDYEREPWKTHIVDPLSHFSEPLKSQLTAKLLRVVEPRSGKIDYDVDGKLVGNWFKENYDFNSGSNGAGDLTIAYDPFQPTNIILSFGDYQGRV
jgi:hypothetical protein